MIALVLLGFLVGVRHALEADHLAAVASLATRSASLGDKVKVAAAWGGGHAASLVLLGGVLFALGISLPESASRFLDAVAGGVLVLLGIDVLRRVRRQRVHFHVHRHDGGAPHFHAHAHQCVVPATSSAQARDGSRQARDDSSRAHVLHAARAQEHPRLQHAARAQEHPRLEHAARTHADARGVHAAQAHEHAHALLPRALALGGLHGLAGTGALVLVSMQLLGTGARAFAYVLMFALGSILGMVTFSLVLSLPFTWSPRLLEASAGKLEATLGAATIALGCWMAYRAAAL